MFECSTMDFKFKNVLVLHNDFNVPMHGWGISGNGRCSNNC